MSPDQVVALMESSKSTTDWNKNIETVKAAFNGTYPPFWYPAILASGVAARTLESFGSSAEITIG